MIKILLLGSLFFTGCTDGYYSNIDETHTNKYEVPSGTDITYNNG